MFLRILLIHNQFTVLKIKMFTTLLVLQHHHLDLQLNKSWIIKPQKEKLGLILETKAKDKTYPSQISSLPPRPLPPGVKICYCFCCTSYGVNGFGFLMSFKF